MGLLGDRHTFRPINAVMGTCTPRDAALVGDMNPSSLWPFSVGAQQQSLIGATEPVEGIDPLLPLWRRDVLRVWSCRQSRPPAQKALPLRNAKRRRRSEASSTSQLYFRVPAHLLQYTLLDVDGTFKLPHPISTPSRDSFRRQLRARLRQLNAIMIGAAKPCVQT